MANLFDSANNFKESKIGVISDLESVEVTEELREKAYGEGDKAFTANVITRNVGTDEEQDYRVPKTVIGSLQTILKDNPDVKRFKVLKSGIGMDTSYTVVPMV